MKVLCNKEYRMQHCKNKDCKCCKYCQNIFSNLYICVAQYPTINDPIFKSKEEFK